MVHHVIIHRLVPRITHRLPQKTLWNTEDSHDCVHESNAPSSRADREARLTTPSTHMKPHRHPLGLLQAQLRLHLQSDLTACSACSSENKMANLFYLFRVKATQELPL